MNVHLDPVLDLTLRSGFAILFGATLWHKVRGLDRFVPTVAAYFRDTPFSGLGFARVSAGLSLIWEGAALVGCLLPVDGVVRAGLIAGVLAFYALAMGINLLRGNVMLDCGCSFGAARHPVSYRLVVRNTVLASLAALLALPGSGRALEAMDYMTVAAGTLVAILVFLTAEGAFNIYSQPMGGK